MEFHASALAQLHGLPSPAFDGLVERAAKLVGAPWDSQPLEPGNAAFRQCTFGAFGLLSYYVDESHEVIRIYNVTWAG